MAITKRPTKISVEEFISGAPDAAAIATTAVETASEQSPRRVRKGNKIQITLTMAESTLERVDELAGQMGQSRAALINLAVTQMLQSGLRIDSEK
ncbi:MAG: CopG family transcriptional regulator [Enterovibrio sp.]